MKLGVITIIDELNKLKEKLSYLEQKLMLVAPLSKLDDVVTQYSLGKIDIYNRYAYELNMPKMALIMAINYCKTYVETYEYLNEYGNM